MKLKEIQSLLLYTPLYRIVRFLWFRVKLFFVRRSGAALSGNESPAGYPFEWIEAMRDKVFISGDKFTFLNRSAIFKEQPDWSYSANGKLWSYQLESFEFLWQENLEKERKEMFIAGYSEFLLANPAAFDPYPASLRIINWVKYFSVYKINSEKFSSSLLSQTKRLCRTIEWHLQNNHLLENGFALVFAGQYFNNEKYFLKGKSIIEGELRKQILPDGAHFELSPMYHQLMLHRILDCIHLLQKNRPEEKIFLDMLSSTASFMLGWMNEMKFGNGDMPPVNDSAEGIAPTSDFLNNYGNELMIPLQKVELKECGFRKHRTDNYECLVDLGGLEPAVNPGHSHADSLSFILYVHGKPLIIDTGISTYEKNERRMFERSTSAHNTVCPENGNQSGMWSAFRVGKRAEIVGVNSGDNFFEASVRFHEHGVVHSRRFEFFENSISIRDSIAGDLKNVYNSFLYVEKKTELAHVESKLNLNLASVEFKGDQSIKKADAFSSKEFNKMTACDQFTIQFRNILITTFTIHN